MVTMFSLVCRNLYYFFFLHLYVQERITVSMSKKIIKCLDPVELQHLDR